MASFNLKVLTNERTKKNFSSGALDRSTMMEMKRAIKSMRERSVANGNSEMSLDDINNEIKAARMARNVN